MTKVLLDTNILRIACAERTVKGPAINSAYGELQEFHVVDAKPAGKFLLEQTRYLWGIARRSVNVRLKFYSCELADREYMIVPGSFLGNRGLEQYFSSTRITSCLLVGGSFASSSITSTMHMSLKASRNKRFSEIREAFGNENCVDAALLFCAEMHSLDCVLTCDKRFRGNYSQNRVALKLETQVIFPKELAIRHRIQPSEWLRDRGDTFPDRFWRNLR